MEPLKVDAELLKAAGERLLSAAQGLPDAPEPFSIRCGVDELSQAVALEIPKAENPIIEGLPPMKQNAIGTAESVIEAARRYARGDAQLKNKIEQTMAPPAGGGGGSSAPGGAVGGGGAGVPAAASAASGAGGIGSQLSGMLGMPMQLAQQAGQIPQQVAGMVGSLPQSAMQGAQQVGEQVQQIVEQATASGEKEPQPESDERSEAGGRGERAPVEKPASADERESTINL